MEGPELATLGLPEVLFNPILIQMTSPSDKPWPGQFLPMSKDKREALEAFWNPIRPDIQDPDPTWDLYLVGLRRQCQHLSNS